MSEPDVLIAGAGPTGLVLALWLTRAGIPVRLIDRAAGPGTTSRALIVHARTLELYRQLGIDGTIVDASLEFTAGNLWVGGRRVGHVPLGDMGRGISPFPYMLVLPQDRHEQLLIELLAGLGVRVERGVELTGAAETADGVTARLRASDGREEVAHARYLAGCDGARSAVRGAIGVGFPGGTYERIFYVADVLAHGALMNRELHIALDTADFLAVFPMAGGNHGRLIGSIRTDALRDAGAAERPLAWEDVGAEALSHLALDIDRLQWFSTYHVHHRVAAHFTRGRIFLLGDAAHIHSPVGGQGMNTGIGDAVNLAWKLADVLHKRVSDEVLDTYEPERIAFARRLVSTTDRAFTFVTRNGAVARFVRLRIAPTVIPMLLSWPWFRRYMFRTLSQTSIAYHMSQLSIGAAGTVRAGDRLPWIAPAGDSADNYIPLAARDWQVHVYGRVTLRLAEVCEQRAIPLHAYPWSSAARRAGVRRDAIYLVRPDGYVAFAGRRAQVPNLERYLAKWLRGLPAVPSGVSSGSQQSE
jgi:2-polyprenyl-6-methoxyphenol hydroxylase-like FAD-dependent oxidoreductase